MNKAAAAAAAAAVFRVPRCPDPAGQSRGPSRSSDLREGPAGAGPGRGAFSGLPNDRLSPPAPFPRLQRRYRPGFAPGFLFFPPGFPARWDTWTCVKFYEKYYGIPPPLSTAFPLGFHEVSLSSFLPPPTSGSVAGSHGFALKIEQVFKLFVQSDTKNQCQLRRGIKLARFDRTNCVPGYPNKGRKLTLRQVQFCPCFF